MSEFPPTWEVGTGKDFSPLPAGWQSRLSERQRKLVEHARQYAADPFGVDGHNALLTIAAMAEMLDEAEGV